VASIVLPKRHKNAYECKILVKVQIFWTSSLLARLTPEQLKLSIVVDGALGICM
jgi:hypothetical protein